MATKVKSKDPLKSENNEKQVKIVLGMLTSEIDFNGKITKRKKQVKLMMRRYQYRAHSNCTCKNTNLDNVSYSFNLQYGSSNIGSFSIRYVDGIACISSSGIHNDMYKGLGLGKKAYMAIAKQFGVLESDPNGNTSDQAKRVWESIKAAKIKGGEKPRYRYTYKKTKNGK